MPDPEGHVSSNKECQYSALSVKLQTYRTCKKVSHYIICQTRGNARSSITFQGLRLCDPLAFSRQKLTLLDVVEAIWLLLEFCKATKGRVHERLCTSHADGDMPFSALGLKHHVEYVDDKEGYHL